MSLNNQTAAPGAAVSEGNTEFLVISRGQWDPGAPAPEIENAIERFYDWLQRNIDAGNMLMGSRLGMERACVSRNGVVTDGPFGETKEVIGGFWFVIAPTLGAAGELLASSPCLRHGIWYEVRPLESRRASIYEPMIEALTRGASDSRAPVASP